MSWPEWCFPGVSTNIYLPGAYSDKSVIAAEASERVARRCITTITPLPLVVVPPASSPSPSLPSTLLPLLAEQTHAVPCWSDKDRDSSLKSVMEAKREGERWMDTDRGRASFGRGERRKEGWTDRDEARSWRLERRRVGWKEREE